MAAGKTPFAFGWDSQFPFFVVWPVRRLLPAKGGLSSVSDLNETAYFCAQGKWNFQLDQERLYKPLLRRMVIIVSSWEDAYQEISQRLHVLRGKIRQQLSSVLPPQHLRRQKIGCPMQNISVRSICRFYKNSYRGVHELCGITSLFIWGDKPQWFNLMAGSFQNSAVIPMKIVQQ